jgi:hypothetical protein
MPAAHMRNGATGAGRENILERVLASDQTDEDNNDCCHQQQMYKSSDSVRGHESKYPEDYEYRRDGK